MAVEMPDDIASEMADKLGIYQDMRCLTEDLVQGEHMDHCDCRVLFVPGLVQRMRDAVHAENTILGGE